MALVIGRDELREELLGTEVRATGDHALVMLHGEIDISTVGGLYQHFAALAHDGIRHVSLNLAEVDFMDSTGLSVIIAEHKRVESMGGELIIFSPTPRVRRLFEISGVEQFLNLRPKSVAHADPQRHQSSPS